MISKEQKLKYGEFLRQQVVLPLNQIQQRQKSKKNTRNEVPTYQQDQNYIPQNQMQQKVISPQPKTPPIYPDQFKNPRELQKEMLAKRMESIEYNPFGKVGGGAPNKHHYNIREIPSQSANQNSAQNNFNRRNRSFQNPLKEPQGAYERPNSKKFGRGMNSNPHQLYQMEKNQFYAPQQLKRIPTPQFLQGAYNNAPFISPQFAPPAPYGYVAQQNNINYLGKIQIPSQPKLPYEPNFEPKVQNQMRQRVQPFKPLLDNEYPRQQIQQPQNDFKQNIVSTQDLKELENDIFKKGGRNLLKLENQTQQEIIAKQNEKIRLQQELKRQMEEAARKKQQQKRKRMEEDQLLDKKNKQFLEREKLKYEQQLKGKKNVAKNVQEANANLNKAIEQPVDLKKQKFRKIREQVAKRQQEEMRQAGAKKTQNQKQNQQVLMSPKQIQKPFISNELDQIPSEISNQTQHSKGFNTAISKQFFKKEREKGKIQKFTEQVHKMRKEIAHQGAQFHQELQKLQREAEKAKKQKEQADEEIVRLKRQLRDKMDVNNKKFLQQIYKGKVQINDPYYADEVKLQQNNVNVLKPKPNQQLIVKQYPSAKYLPEENVPFDGTNSVMSLIGDSKKIPINIDSSETMSISNLGNFAKDTEYFNSIKKQNNKQLKQRFSPKQSIIEQDQQRNQDSRQSKRSIPKQPRQQLDRLIESRKKSRGGWGELSSVNGEIVDQIEKMLQNKSRPNSHLSSVGEKTLVGYENRLNGDNQEIKRKKSDLYGGERQNGENFNNLDALLQKYI